MILSPGHAGACGTLVERAERCFEFATLGTSWKTELLAGVTAATRLAAE